MLLLLLLACDGTPPDTPADDPVGPGDSGEAETRPACLDGNHLAVLGEHLAVMRIIGLTGADSVDADTVLGFYQLPGVDAARAFQLELGRACDGNYDLDPFWSYGVKFWTECTGDGADWVEHAENDETDFEGWAVDRARIEIAWTEGATGLGVTWDVRGLADPDGIDFTFSGAARLDAGLVLDQAFANLHPDGVLTLWFADEAGGARLDGADLASWNGQGLSPSGCD